jgi:hypothetical protein
MKKEYVNLSPKFPEKVVNVPILELGKPRLRELK